MRRGWVAGIAALLAFLVGVGVLGVVGVVALLGPWEPAPPNPPIVVDRAAAMSWTQAAAPAVRDLDAAGPLPGLRSDGPTDRYPCHYDSGDLLEGGALRTWTVTHPGRGYDSDNIEAMPSATAETMAGFRSLVRSLRTAGWTVEDRRALPDLDLPPGERFGAVTLVRPDVDERLFVDVQVWPSDVTAEVGVTGIGRTCRRG